AHDQQQRQRSVLQLPINTLTIPKITTNEELDAEGERALSRSTSPLPLDISGDSGRYYGSISSPSSITQTIKTADSGIIIDCGRNTPLSPSGESASTLSPCRSEVEIIGIAKEKEEFYNKEFKKFWERICPLNWKKFQNAGWAGKIYRILKIPSLLLLGLTIPIAGKWSKPLAIVHAFLFPLILCSAFKFLMFGNLFNIPYQILGLTAVAWCNSIGDLIADVSVARQGMPRMALSAAIGGPLFNLMVGFGSSFTIAKLQGKEVTLNIKKWLLDL
uniref:Sodium/calcium exchanger membrane region domain-containing protein n=1 Tax=Meloidogyne javanica TaxID=6303 RepID=A0A915LJJ7_MELJA